MRRKRPAHQKLDTAKKMDLDWILNIKENIAAPSIILRSSLTMPGQAMRRSLLIHLHVSKWYQRQNKSFLVGSRSFQNLVFKASHRRLCRQTTYASTHFFTDSKIFWKIPGRRKGPLQGVFVEILPRSLFGSPTSSWITPSSDTSSFSYIQLFLLWAGIIQDK